LASSSEGRAVTRSDGNDEPSLDPSVLKRLRDDMQNGAGVRTSLTRNFTANVQRRVEELRFALITGDADGAMGAVRGLRTSSETIGAKQLACLAFDLEQDLRVQVHARDVDLAIVLPQLAVAYMARISQCAQQTAQLLQT